MTNFKKALLHLEFFLLDDVPEFFKTVAIGLVDTLYWSWYWVSKKAKVAWCYVAQAWKFCYRFMKELLNGI